MRTLLTVIVTAIVTVAIFLWISVFRPEWLVRLQYDKFGFPRIRTRGDQFILEGQHYVYDGDKWVKTGADWFPLTPAEGDSWVIGGVGYKFTGGVWVKITNPGDPSEVRNLIGLAGINVVFDNVTGFPISPTPFEGMIFSLNNAKYIFSNGYWSTLNSRARVFKISNPIRGVICKKSGDQILCAYTPS